MANSKWYFIVICCCYSYYIRICIVCGIHKHLRTRSDTHTHMSKQPRWDQSRQAGKNERMSKTKAETDRIFLSRSFALCNVILFWGHIYLLIPFEILIDRLILLEFFSSSSSSYVAENEIWMRLRQRLRLWLVLLLLLSHYVFVHSWFFDQLIPVRL